MNNIEYAEQYKLWLDHVNSELDKLIIEKDAPEKVIYDAMRYSLLAGGKRLRPILSLAVCDMLNGNIMDVLPYACAIEMIHTYSLIHDDLPSMDNDDFRRGRLTNHKVFGEAKAILAGDALLNYAFEIMLEDLYKASNSPDLNIRGRINAMKIISNASGVSGMIAGQVVDIESEGKVITADLLHYMHKNKTGALIKAPVLSSAVICSASDDEYKSLEKFAEKLGIAFQIRDDVLDVEGNQEIMGKASNSDAAKMKATYVSIYGIDKSKELLIDTTNEAISQLCKFGEKGNFLKELSKNLVNRIN